MLVPFSSKNRLIAATCALPLVLTAGPASGGDGELPEVLELVGVVRDFRERSHPEGHPDFERKPDSGFGHYCGNVAATIGPGRKPAYLDQGKKVSSQWRDSEGRPICHLLYDSGRGDTAGRFGASDSGGIASAETFRQWFKDVQGINQSKALTLRLYLQDDGRYVFDDKDDPHYEQLDGFFPLEDQLFGNPGGYPDRNFHFTFELHSEFVYRADIEQVFRFVGDDDVWVFINDQLVIDLGGVHSAVEQYVDLSRLDLVDGETYTLDFFFAERHRTQSNFRMETTLELTNVDVPSVSAAYD